MSSTSVTHLAVVPKSAPLKVMTSSDSSNLSPQHGDDGLEPFQKKRKGNGHPEGDDESRALVALYESYATLYPNPRLVQERQEAHMLLQAMAAADGHLEMDPHNSDNNNQTRGRWWKNMWPLKRSGSSNESKKQNVGAHQSTFTSEEDDSPFSDRLVYAHDRISDVEDDGDDEGDALCGTGGPRSSLDLTCIPDEAHSLARFHLASRRRGPHRGAASQGRPVVARTAWERAGTRVVAIVGLGVLAEWPVPFSPVSQDHRQGGTAAADDSSGGGGQVTYTRDRGHLRSKCDRPTHDPITNAFHVSRVRAALVGPNLLIVSWGLPDALVMFYRRVTRTASTSPRPSGSEEDAAMWEPVAFSSPTEAVLANLDVLAQEDEEHGASALLRVTDLVTLVVEIDGAPPAVTLAISRLGGYLELIPLPPTMWYGPELQLPPPPKPVKRAGKRATPSPNSLETLPNISHSGASVALSTIEYQQDVICMGAFRTVVNQDTEWNVEKYPSSTPAEHVLAASGMKNGHETISFWSVSTIFMEDSTEQQAAGADGIGFSIRASLAEALDLGPVGPRVSIFASKRIMRHWRKPRRVILRDSLEGSTYVDQQSESTTPVTTLALPAPIVSIEFSVRGESVHAALLDWNGSVTILSCDWLMRCVSQTLSDDAYTSIFHPSDETVVPLATTLVHRATFAREVAIGAVLPSSISDTRWFAQIQSASSGPLLAVSTCFPVPSLKLIGVQPLGSELNVLATVELPAGLIYSYHSLERNGELVLVNSSIATDHKILMLSGIQRLHPTEIIRNFWRREHYKEAVQSAMELTLEEQSKVANLIDECKKKRWELESHWESLETVTDTSYIVQEAMCMTDQSHSLLRQQDLTLFRAVHQLALERVSNATDNAAAVAQSESVMDDLRSRLIKAGTYELLCGQRSLTPSFATFCERFVDLPVVDLARQLAAAADLPSLSLVVYRHAEVMKTTKVANEIPLVVHPRLYAHILPIQDDGRIPGPRFIAVSKSDRSLSHWSKMPGCIMDLFQCSVVLDEADLQITLQQARRHSEKGWDGARNEKASLESWYCERIRSLNSFVYNFEYTWTFGQLAMLALGEADTSLSPIGASAAVSYIFRSTRNSEILNELTLDGVHETMPVINCDLNEMATMGLNTMASLALAGYSDAVEVFARYKKYLVPLAELNLASDSDLQSALDQALAVLCVRQLETVVLANRSDFLHSLRKGVEAAAAITSLSRTSLEMKNRLIKSKSVLIETVLTFAEKVIAASSGASTDQSESRRIINALWIMYEALPVSLASESQECPLMLSGMDDLYRTLVVIDVIQRWPGCDSFGLVLSQLQAEKGGDNSDAFFAEAIVSICKSFFMQLSRKAPAKVTPETKELLACLLSDASELSIVFLPSSSTKQRILQRALLAPLLWNGHMELVCVVVLHSGTGWVDEDALLEELTVFLEDAAFLNGETFDSDYLIALLDNCDRFLSRSLGILSRPLDIIRHYVTVATMINSMMETEASSWRCDPTYVRDTPPLDILIAVLKAAPMIIVTGCEGWADPEWARAANSKLRSSLQSKAEHEVELSQQTQLPIVPGQAVSHLAQMLLQNCAKGKIVFKSILAKRAVQLGLFGAAAAICRTLSSECAQLCESACTKALLETITTIVSQNSYDDLMTKRELCEVTLCGVRAEISFSHIRLLETILASHSVVNLRSLHAESGILSPFASIKRFVHDQLEYQVDIAKLFETLCAQASATLVDDGLMRVLAQHAFYWCIAQATRPRPVVTTFDESRLRSIGLIGVFSLGHIQDVDMASVCVLELQNIFNKQLRLAQGQHLFLPSGTSIEPDADIVRRLVGRGYSALGARRAATCSPSATFEDALQWAVAHSSDLNFNEPLIQVKPRNPSLLAVSLVDSLAALFRLATLAASNRRFEELTSKRKTAIIEKVGVPKQIDSRDERKPSLSARETSRNDTARSVINKSADCIETVQVHSPRLKMPFQEAESDTMTRRQAPIASPSSDQQQVPTNRSVPKASPTKNVRIAIQNSISTQDAPSSQELIEKVELFDTTGKAVAARSVDSENVQQVNTRLTPVSSTSQNSLKVIAQSAELPSKSTNLLAPPSKTTFNGMPALSPASNELSHLLSTPASLGVDEASSKRSSPTNVDHVRATSSCAPRSWPVQLSAANSPTPTLAGTSPDRSSLRDLGRAALMLAKQSNTPNKDDRRRLIEEGRRLLERARQATGGFSPTADTYVSGPSQAAGSPSAKAPTSAPYLSEASSRSLPPLVSSAPKTNKEVAANDGFEISPLAETLPLSSRSLAPLPPSASHGEKEEEGWDFGDDF